MDTEEIKTIEQAEEVKEPASKEKDDLADIRASLKSISERLEKQEKRELTQKEIREIAEKNVIETSVEEEVESIKLERRTKEWEKQKTKLELRNHMWDELTSRFVNDEVPRAHIRSGMLDGGFNSGIGQALSLALFRYLAPNNGVSLQDLDAISLIEGEKVFGIRNNPRSIIRQHSR